MNSYHSKNWFACPQPNPGAETRLFLFPYAGGGPATFGKWPATLPDSIEAWIAHYPGRGSRYNEPAFNRINPLVESLLKAIQLLLDKPIALFGHSLGGLLAFELARQLHRLGLPEPQILFVSACGAPGMPDPHPPVHALPDPEFVQALQEFDGIPAEIANLPELAELLFPALRADFEAVETYLYESDGPRLGCRILAFGGLDDPRVSRERLEGWHSHTSSSFRAQYFPGDHFFLNTAREAVIATIADQLVSSRAKN